MDNEKNTSNELYHYGVLGMKWGRHKNILKSYSKPLTRLHPGPSIYLNRKKQLKVDKQDLEDLKKGQHLSIAFTKKAQSKYDSRDKQLLEKRIKKNTQYLKEHKPSEDYIRSKKLKKKGYKNLSTNELQELNRRLQAERQFKSLNPSAVATGIAVISTLGTIASMTDNINKIKKFNSGVITDGKKIVDKYVRKGA